MMPRMIAMVANTANIAPLAQWSVPIATTQKATYIPPIEPSATTAVLDSLLTTPRIPASLVSRGSTVSVVLTHAFRAKRLLVSSVYCHNRARAFTVARGRKQIRL